MNRRNIFKYLGAAAVALAIPALARMTNDECKFTALGNEVRTMWIS